MNNETVRLSKFLSLVLRHQPDAANVKLDESGWVDVEILLKGCASKGKRITRDQLNAVVRDNDKKRFIFSDDGRMIRASQGHSVKVELGYKPCEPPAILYHGTATRFLDYIKRDGLLKMSRQHVHLSATLETALKVGARHGAVVVLAVKSVEMHHAGEQFYLTPNKVWLTEKVLPGYIDFANLIYPDGTY
jgi:putative RNA 2'-phosphotransferase